MQLYGVYACDCIVCVHTQRIPAGRRYLHCANVCVCVCRVYVFIWWMCIFRECICGIHRYSCCGYSHACTCMQSPQQYARHSALSPSTSIPQAIVFPWTRSYTGSSKLQWLVCLQPPQRWVCGQDEWRFQEFGLSCSYLHRKRFHPLSHLLCLNIIFVVPFFFLNHSLVRVFNFSPHITEWI